jgi:hypothetical protein
MTIHQASQKISGHMLVNLVDQKLTLTNFQPSRLTIICRVHHGLAKHIVIYE